MATALSNEEIKQRALYDTVDPTVTFPTPKGPGDMPALTTMLHRVCNNESTKFEEAVRLIELFMDEVLKIHTEG